MRQLPALILGFILLAAPLRSATQAPSEAEISAKLQAVTREKERLEAELNAAKSRPGGRIEAEVRGIMMKDASGYYIQTRMGRGVELRVWIPPSPRTSDTVFDALTGKDVVADGQLLQRIVVPHGPELSAPEDPKTAHSANVPSNGLYLKNTNIRDAKQPAPPSIPSLPTVPPALPANPK